MTLPGQPIKLAIIGITGRMGCEICSLASAASGHLVVTGVSSSGAENTVAKITDLDPKLFDLVIDFSLPVLTEDVARWCAANNKPLVSGVTGLSDKQKEFLQTAALKTAVLWAPNMSLGVAVMARMFKEFSNLRGFDFQIEELHHHRKKDRPSGTALYLQEKLKASTTGDIPEPVAIRGGGVFGIHRVWALAEEEMLTIEHTAMNRRVFARGALRAASWLADRAPGLYGMDDVLS